jgi:hypothetical protein
MNAFASSPAGQKIIQGVEATAIAAADNTLQQYERNGNVQAKDVAQASLSSVSQQLTRVAGDWRRG